MISKEEAKQTSIDCYGDNIMKDIHWIILDLIEHEIILAAQNGLTSTMFKVEPKYREDFPSVIHYLRLIGYKVSYTGIAASSILKKPVSIVTEVKISW